jgi:hypothetical protein
MAKISGPLMSMGASGAIKKSLLFSKWRGKKIVRRVGVVGVGPSAGQSAARSVMGAAYAAYRFFIGCPYELAAFDLSASISPRRLSGFNYFCKRWVDVFSLVGVPPFLVGWMETWWNTGGEILFVFATETPDFKVKYGFSPRNLCFESFIGEYIPPDWWLIQFGSLPVGSTLYFQFRSLSGPDRILSGVYSFPVLP